MGTKNVLLSKYRNFFEETLVFYTLRSTKLNAIENNKCCRNRCMHSCERRSTAYVFFHTFLNFPTTFKNWTINETIDLFYHYLLCPLYQRLRNSSSPQCEYKLVCFFLQNYVTACF